jgi:hypothetical protein
MTITIKEILHYNVIKSFSLVKDNVPHNFIKEEEIAIIDNSLLLYDKDFKSALILDEETINNLIKDNYIEQMEYFPGDEY